MIAVYVTAIFYLGKYSYGNLHYPGELIRALCGLLLGYTAYHASKYLKKLKLTAGQMRWLSAAELIFVFFPLFMSYFNIQFLRLFLVSFWESVVIIFSEQSLIPDLKGKCWEYLGSLSMPIYIWHYPVGLVINRIPGVVMIKKIIVYYALTIITAAISMYVIKKWKIQKV